MKVLVIPSWYPSGADKLMGIYHKEYCEALSHNGLEVDMLYIKRERLSAPLKYLFMPKNAVIKENGYTTYIKKMLDIHKISFKLQIKNYCRKLEKLYLEYLKNHEKPDLFHAQVTFPAGYATCVLGKKYGIPVVVTEHASYFKRFFNNEYEPFGKYVLANSTFTTVSKFMTNEIIAMGGKSEVLPNLVDTTIFNKKRSLVSDLKLVTVSALREGKEIDKIIQALKIIIEKGYQATLTIVGDGFKAEYYQNICHNLKMDNYVSFVGQKNKQEIADILVKHNIFVIASVKETFCIPGIEALASGMPVVSTKCLGPEEYIDEKCGALVDIGDYEALAESIIKVYENLAKYDVNYLRSVANRYSAEAITKEALRIYQETLNNNKTLN